MSEGSKYAIYYEPDEYLPVVKAPFLEKKGPDREYTLVLDLDETLVHYFETENEGHVLVRPGTEDFLLSMSRYYEIVIFTAALQDYADWVIDQIDTNKCVSYRLYRQHATSLGSVFVKDLSKLGRDLSKIIIVDNVYENFQLQSENGILIRSWFEDPEDIALYELSPLLIEIAEKRFKDVRTALKDIRDKMQNN